MTAFWRNWLTIWCWAVFGFGVVLALGAVRATEWPVVWLLEMLGGAPVEMTPALRFSMAVMGPVSIGWSFTLMAAIRAAIELGDKGRPVWLATTLGAVSWFVLDSLLSVVTGFGLNVVPNVGFIATYLIPVVASGVLKRR